MFGAKFVEYKMVNIRQAAIDVREELIRTNGGNKRILSKIEKIIRVAVYLKWMHRLAMLFFMVWAAAFLYLMYPDAKGMIFISIICALGYVVSLTFISIQIKRYRNTIKKAHADIYRDPGNTVQQSSGVLWQACRNAWPEDNK